MEHETLFTATKWDILKLLEKGPQSPLEISKQVGSSLANISQQLRLLELAGLVKTQRVSNRDKDKPRILYSLAGNLSYLIATSDNFVDKKLLSLTDRNKIILRVWFIEDQQVRYALEKAFWQIEPELGSITKLTYAGLEKGVPVLEYAGTAKLTQHGQVLLRHTDAPSGLVLYDRQ
jgi:predicted transcriptional regulator